MDNYLIKNDEEKQIEVKNEIENNVGDIFSNDDMKNMLRNIIKECDDNRKEALDSYYIFKDMILNSGDFDSSSSTKEQLAILLQTAQSSSDSKIKLFESVLRAKIKQQEERDKSKSKQSGIFGGLDRRSLLKALDETKDFLELDIEEKQEEIKNINENQEFSIKSGDF